MPKVVDELKGRQAGRDAAGAGWLRVVLRHRFRPELRRPRKEQAPARRQHQSRRAGRHDHRARTCSTARSTWASPASATSPSWNVPGAVARYMTFDPSRRRCPYLVAKAWDVNEETTTGLRARQHRHRMGLDVRCAAISACRCSTSTSPRIAILGQHPAGRQQRAADRSAARPITDVLPSMNLAFSLRPTTRPCAWPWPGRWRVRAWTSCAPRWSSASDTRTDNGTSRGRASGGNPELDPWRANAFDISYEKYFGNKAYVAAAYLLQGPEVPTSTPRPTRWLRLHRVPGGLRSDHRRAAGPDRPAASLAAVQRRGRHACRAWS